MVSPEDFVDDTPWSADPAQFQDVPIENQIEGVKLQRLLTNSDDRGDLTVLMSDLFDELHRAPHVYLVTAKAGSLRAWVYHKRQSDRLAYTNGDIRVVLYDIRKESRTSGQLNVINVGVDNKVLLTIPPFVVHGVYNQGNQDAFFVNMPTRAYDPAWPDKSRLPKDSPLIPYSFD